jgi:RNA polymerase sigma-70 factor (ECF subfamily)
VTLAFVAGLQRLPRQQRAVLVLRDVLGFRATEVAEMLDTSEAAVNSALQRARATVEARRPADRERARLPRSGAEREVVADFADAVESGDVPRMVALLTDDAVLTMPPLPLEYEGREAIAAFLEASEQGRGAPLRVLESEANSDPALVAYLPDEDGGAAKLYGSMVLTLREDAITAITFFIDASPFRQANLPAAL